MEHVLMVPCELIDGPSSEARFLQRLDLARVGAFETLRQLIASRSEFFQRQRIELV
jgi:hypothetical protein